MADNYLTSDDYDAHLGADVVAAAVEAVGVDGVHRLSERATAFVQGFMRNEGYSIPAPADLTNELVRLAVAAALREIISGIPDLSMPLPEDWDKRIEKRALEGILSGDTQLDLPQRTGDSPGGATIISTATSATQPQRSSRRELSGY